MNNLLSPEEVKSFLEVDEQGLEQFIQRGKLQAFKLGGAYLRFRKEEVLALKHEAQPVKKTQPFTPWHFRLRDFWRFNNFYILSLFVIAFLIFIIVRS